MPTFARRFRRSIPETAPEWTCAIVILSIGMIWLLYPENFSRPGMETFTEIMAPRSWTALCISVGIAGVCFLAFHTEWPRTFGVLRFLRAVVGCWIFGAFIGRNIETMAVDGLSWAVALYAGYFLLDLRSAFVAAGQTLNAFRKVGHVVPMVR